MADAAFSHWWQHPLVLVAWSVGVMIAYSLSRATDAHALIAEAIWMVGVVVWMIGADRD